MGASYQLLIGLGNPGARYEATRHNAGVWLLERVARRYASGFRSLARCFGSIADADIEGTRVRLFRPIWTLNLRTCPSLRLTPTRVLCSEWPIGSSRSWSGRATV